MLGCFLFVFGVCVCGGGIGTIKLCCSHYDLFLMDVSWIGKDKV